MSFNFHIFKVNFAFTLLIFSAILSGAVSPAFSASQQLNSLETVFCPLTKKNQPVHPQKNNLLDEFCASNLEKENFSKAIIEQFTAKFNNFNKTDLENLVFDYWQNEKTAFENLPQPPNQPEKTLAKNSLSNVVFTNIFEHQIVWKTVNKFSFQLNQRPPPIQNNSKFEFVKVQTLRHLSRQIAPRAPPILFS